MTEEHAAGTRSAEAYASLIRAAGMTFDEFADEVRTGGINVAVRRACGKAEKRRVWTPTRVRAELARRRYAP